MQDGIFDLSAQLAYYFLLSFFPFLFLVMTLLAYLPFESQNVLALIRPFIPEESMHLIQVNLTYLLDIQRGDLLSISLLSTFYLASLAFQSMIRILNQAYQINERRPFWKNIILGILFMIGLFLALLISLMLPVFGKLIGKWVTSWFHVTGWYTMLWSGMRWVISSIVLFMIFLFIYKYVPNTTIAFRQALPGTILSTFGWQLVSLIFSSYVNLNHYSLIYGNLGGVIILVGWFYLTAFILVLGGQLNAVFQSWYEMKVEE